jgi:hypothetical protein
MGRHIVVLGTDHALQGAERVPLEKKINDPTYGALLEKLIRDYAIECIFEEAFGPTTASSQERPGLKYVPVDPPGPDRKTHGIPEGLAFEAYVIYEISDPRRPNPEPFATQKKVDTEFAREKVWVERIKRESFTSGLMICGCAHIFSVASRLADSGFSVDVIIYMGPTLLDLLTRVSACKSEQDFGAVISDMKSWTTFEPISRQK